MLMSRSAGWGGWGECEGVRLEGERAGAGRALGQWGVCGDAKAIGTQPC
jgi:hypothetical protein